MRDMAENRAKPRLGFYLLLAPNLLLWFLAIAGSTFAELNSMQYALAFPIAFAAVELYCFFNPSNGIRSDDRALWTQQPTLYVQHTGW